jgi:hypothetical protein
MINFFVVGKKKIIFFFFWNIKNLIKIILTGIIGLIDICLLWEE